MFLKEFRVSYFETIHYVILCPLGFDLEIIMALVIKILPVQNIRKMKNNTSKFSKKLTFVPRTDIDRRKRIRDRRHSVRNGVHVRLTFKTDQRCGFDRRNKKRGRPRFQVLSIRSSSDKKL